MFWAEPIATVMCRASTNKDNAFIVRWARGVFENATAGILKSGTRGPVVLSSQERITGPRVFRHHFSDARLVECRSHQINGVLPGMATGASDNCISQVKSLGIVSSFELSACSQLTCLPVYADMRPMMAVSVLSATRFNSLIGLPERMLSIKSVCSCT